MKKIKTLLVLSGLAVSVLAGCGTQTASSTTSSATTSNSSELTTSSSEAKVLASIRIVSEPTKKNYFVGDEFDPAGLSVKAVYTTGEEDLAASDYQLSGFDSATAGEKTITVTFQGQTATFKVTVAEAVLESIRVAANPTKVAYFPGEEFDPAGIQVKAKYNNGSERDVAVADLAFSGFDSATSGEKTITVTFQEKTATFTVEVVAQNGIEITAAPNKVRYGIGDEFDATGLKVSKTFANGGKQELAASDYQLSGFDSATAGEKTITVTAGTYTAEFKVNVYNNDWTDEEKEVWTPENEDDDTDLLFEIPFHFGFKLAFEGIPNADDPTKLDVGWYTARTDFAVTDAELETYLDMIDGIKTVVTDEDTGAQTEKLAWSLYKPASGKLLTDDVDVLGFDEASEVFQYARWSHDTNSYFAFQLMSVGLDPEGKLLVVATQCIYPLRGYGKENNPSYVKQDGYNMVDDIYYLIAGYCSYIQYSTPVPPQDGPYFDYGIELPGYDDDTFCYYINEAADSPYILANVFSERFNIADFSLIYGTGKQDSNGNNVPYTQADLDAILAKYTARNIEVVHDTTTYKIPVDRVEFVGNGLSLSIEYYITNGFLRIDVDVRGYSKPVTPTPEGSTTQSVMYDILHALLNPSLTWDDFVKYNLVQEVSEGVWYGYCGLGTADESLFAKGLALVEQYLPGYLIPVSEPVLISDYQGGNGYMREYITSDGTISVEVVMNVYQGSMYADFYVSPATSN